MPGSLVGDYCVLSCVMKLLSVYVCVYAYNFSSQEVEVDDEEYEASLGYIMRQSPRKEEGEKRKRERENQNQLTKQINNPKAMGSALGLCETLQIQGLDNSNSLFHSPGD